MISRAHVQTIAVFPLPELLNERRRLKDSRSWFRHLQADIARGRAVNKGEFKLVPAFDFTRNQAYQENYWKLFRSGRGLPEHFPYKFRFEKPYLGLDSQPFQISNYDVRFRGLLFPYGAVSLR